MKIAAKRGRKLAWRAEAFDPRKTPRELKSRRRGIGKQIADLSTDRLRAVGNKK